jgi:MFS family permease
MLAGMNRLAALRSAFGRVLGNRNVRNLQLAGAGDVLGTYAYAVALPVYAYHAGGTRAVGLLFFARFVFAALAVPWLGVLADRWSRQRLMLWADALRFAIFAVMTAVAGTGGSAWVIFVLAVTSTVISGAYPPARAALLPSLVESPEELTSANLVGNSIATVGMLVGFALGGILLAVSSPTAVFAVNGVTFLWSIAFLLRIPADAPPKQTEHPRFLPELIEGFTTVARRPALRALVGLSAAQSMVEGAFNVLIVVLALRVLDRGNATVGWLNTGMGIGSIIGIGAVAVLASRRRLAGGFALGILLWGFPLALAAATTTLAPAIILLVLVGVGVMLVETNGLTLMQRSAENEVLGRVFAVFQSLIFASLALGAILAPVIVNWLGPRGALIATGLFLPAVLVPAWPTLRRIDAEARIADGPLALLRKIEMFSQLPEPTLERLAAEATTVNVAAGETVVVRGESGDHFYVIASGRAAVELDDGTFRTLAPGDFFGEIALLRDVPRTATVRAVQPLQLYAIERNEFIATVTGHAPTLASAQNIMISRLPVGAVVG